MTAAALPELENVAVARRHGTFALRRGLLAPPRPGEVRFRVLHASLCGTDRQIARGDRSDTAVVLGHEGVAEVAAVGDGVSGHSLGDRVVFNPVNPGNQDEILGHSTEGLFQRFMTFAASDLERRALVVPVPRGLPSAACVLAEPLGTVVYTHELLRRAGSPASLVVVGAGPIGILHALYAARIARVGRVRLVANTEARARWVVQRSLLPAADVLLWDEPLGELLARSLAGSSVVLLCVPARAMARALEFALAAVADGGLIGLVGGAGSRQIDALPGTDLVAIRRANVCGSIRSGDAAIAAVRARDGRRVGLFGQRGAAARHLRQALAVLADDATFARVLTHRATLAALPGLLESIARCARIDEAECVKLLVDATAERASVETFDGGRV
jgi:threonine dehydrogenase-like Zn-dependent dehydrogenase